MPSTMKRGCVWLGASSRPNTLLMMAGSPEMLDRCRMCVCSWVMSVVSQSSKSASGLMSSGAVTNSRMAS
jgi:hypothetical protein